MIIMKTNQNQEVRPLTLLDRLQAPTPSFFKKLRNAGLLLAAIAGGILTAPIALPSVIVTAAGYIMVASGVLSAVSQVTVESEA